MFFSDIYTITPMKVFSSVYLLFVCVHALMYVLHHIHAGIHGAKKKEHEVP